MSVNFLTSISLPTPANAEAQGALSDTGESDNFGNLLSAAPLQGFTEYSMANLHALTFDTGRLLAGNLNNDDPLGRKGELRAASDLRAPRDAAPPSRNSSPDVRQARVDHSTSVPQRPQERSHRNEGAPPDKAARTDARGPNRAGERKSLREPQANQNSDQEVQKRPASHNVGNGQAQPSAGSTSTNLAGSINPFPLADLDQAGATLEQSTQEIIAGRVKEPDGATTLIKRVGQSATNRPIAGVPSGLATATGELTQPTSSASTQDAEISTNNEQDALNRALSQLRSEGLARLTGTRNSPTQTGGEPVNNGAQQSFGEQAARHQVRHPGLPTSQTGQGQIQSGSDLTDTAVKSNLLTPQVAGTGDQPQSSTNVERFSQGFTANGEFGGQQKGQFSFGANAKQAKPGAGRGAANSAPNGQTTPILKADARVNLQALGTKLTTPTGFESAQLLRNSAVEGSQTPANKAPSNVARVAIPALAQSIAKHARAGESRFEIRLDPPELGRVDVRLRVADDGTVRAHLIVERPETLDLISRDQRNLERQLEQAGLKTENGGLQFSLRHGGGQPFSQFADHPASGREQNSARKDEGPDAGVEPLSATQVARSQAENSDLLDLVV